MSGLLHELIIGRKTMWLLPRLRKKPLIYIDTEISSKELCKRIKKIRRDWEKRNEKNS